MCVEYLWTGRGPRLPAPGAVAELIDRLEAMDPDRREEILRFAEFRAKD